MMYLSGGSIYRGLLILALVAGCESQTTVSDVSDPLAGVNRGQFGDPYRVVGNFNPADPDLYPQLAGDTLRVRVTYAGGCESHRLEADYDARGDTAFVWIRHDARNDDCEALIHDEVETVLPERIAAARVIAVLHPQGGPPQVLSR